MKYLIIIVLLMGCECKCPEVKDKIEPPIRVENPNVRRWKGKVYILDNGRWWKEQEYEDFYL